MDCFRKRALLIVGIGGIAALASLAASTPACAWYKHQALMPELLAGKPFRDARILSVTMAPPCDADYSRVLGGIARDLELSPAILRSPSPFASACQERRPVKGAEILAGPSIDEPDESGMDENLPDSVSHAGDRRWFGGFTGPLSKGFRHFYFAGWRPQQPIASFQLPAEEIGIAPERAALIGSRARATLRAGPAMEPWGYRLLAWSLHYLQDLTQPFHVSQDVSPALIPWRALLAWPTIENGQRFLQETDRVITNYHWALEGYVRERAKEGADSPWSDCLENPASYWTIPERISAPTSRSGDEPEKMRQLARVAREVASVSRDLAGELGWRMSRFFEGELAAPGASFQQGTVRLDYAALAIRPDLERPRSALHETICKCLANSAWVTAWLLQWAGAP